MLIKLLPLLLIFCLSITNASTQQERWINKKSEGWFWYQREPIEPEIIDDEPQNIQIITSKDSEPLSTKWLNENIPYYLELAIDNPTPTNVKAYFVLQRYAMDKANKFANVAEQVVFGDPLIDETIRRPANQFGSTELKQSALVHERSLVKEISKNIGIFYFFQHDSASEKQANVLTHMQKADNLHVIGVSMDGSTEPIGELTNILVNNNQAEIFNISSLPALVAVSDTGYSRIISQNLISATEIRKRLLFSALEAGIIDDDELQQTTPIFENNSIMLTKKIDVERPSPDKILEQIKKAY